MNVMLLRHTLVLVTHIIYTVSSCCMSR